MPNELRDLRERAGLSRRQVCDLLGIPPSRLSRFERHGLPDVLSEQEPTAQEEIALRMFYAAVELMAVAPTNKMWLSPNHRSRRQTVEVAE